MTRGPLQKLWHGRFSIQGEMMMDPNDIGIVNSVWVQSAEGGPNDGFGWQSAFE